MWQCSSLCFGKLVLSATLFGALALFTQSAHAACSPTSTNESVAICTPASGSQVTSPVTIQAAANTGVPVLKFLLYVDNNLVYQDTSGSKSVSAAVSLAAGTHYLVAQYYDTAWRVGSETFAVVAGGGCPPNSTSPSVQICSPVAGSTVNSPVTIQATAASSTPVQKFMVYVDNVLKYQDTSGATTITTTQTLSAGSHYLVLQFYNGAWVVQSETFNVASSGGGCPPKSTSPSINICSPVAGSTVNSPVTITGTAASSTPIQKFLVYVDNVLKYQDTSGAATITTSQALGAGAHNLILQFYNGAWVVQSETFYIASGVIISVSPSTVSMPVRSTGTFYATVQGTTNTAVTWSVDGIVGGNTAVGTITSAGVYTAPMTAGTHRITATSVADTTKSSSATVTITTPAPPGAVAVMTYHNDGTRSGANTSEKTLNPSNVNFSQFGKKLAYAVDGQIYAQPLYVPNLKIGGVNHNVVFVVTEANSVYAFDADGVSSLPLWHKSLGTPVTVTDTTGIYPYLGITGTPVIDQATGTMYVVAETPSPRFLLHALDLLTGNEKFGGPVSVTATVNGTGWDSAGGKLSLEGGCYQRNGLALSNNNVIITFGHCAHGWVLLYDKATLQQTGVFNTTPDGAGGALWGGAPAIDPSNGDFYLITGVDFSDPITTGFNDAFLHLRSNNASVADYFSPSDQAVMMNNDADLGSGGAIVMPDNTSAHPHQLIGGGKDGRIFVLNRDSLGQTNMASVLQTVQTGTQQFDNIFSTPVYWNGHLYYHCEQDVLKAYSWTNGLLSTSPTSQGVHVFGTHGATGSLSANGNVDGIVWEIESTNAKAGGPAILRAYDALNVAVELYDSSQDASRDQAGPAIKFTVPTVADGHVFVGTGNQLDIYGLF